MPPSQQNKPKVYIVILTWNQHELTADCLHSLMHLSYPNARIVVVDNASGDGTPAKLQAEFGDQIEIVCNEENLGFSEGNNIGIRYALDHGADYVMLLNNDTLVDPDFAGPLVERLENDAAVAASTPKIYYMHDRSLLWAAGGQIWWWQGAAGCRGENEVDRGQYDQAETVDYAQGCCMLCSRHVLETVGLLNPRFFIYFDEVDWAMRCREAGYQIWYEPDSVIWHLAGQAMTRQADDGQGQAKRHSQRFHYLHHRNGLWFFRRHARGLKLPVGLSVFTARAVLYSVKLSAQARLDEAAGVWRGLKDGWLTLPQP